MRILLTGAGGLVGRACVRAFSTDDLWALPRAELDICDPVAVDAALAAFRPDAVVNAAAMAQVDECDSDPQRAFAVNAAAPGVLAQAAARHRAAICHLSTDYVFGGAGTPPYDEWAPTAPVQTYGRAKLGGESAVVRANPMHIVARTSWVFTADGGMATRVLEQFRRDGEVRSFADQWNVPTCGDELAATLRRLLAGGHHGVFHVCGVGRVSRSDLSRAILAAAGEDPGAVVDVALAGVKGLSPRPTDTTMEPRALRLAGIAGPGAWQPALERALAASTA